MAENISDIALNVITAANIKYPDHAFVIVAFDHRTGTLVVNSANVAREHISVMLEEALRIVSRDEPKVFYPDLPPINE